MDIKKEIQMVVSPYEEDPRVKSRGATVDAKVAKLNNREKRPTLQANWINGRPVIKVNSEAVVEDKNAAYDYDELLEKTGARAVTYVKSAKSVGAKKLRVTKIVLPKFKKTYAAVKKENAVEEEMKQTLVNQISELTKPEEVEEEVHGRHEPTGEIPVNDVRAAIRQELTGTTPAVSSRMEKNASSHEETDVKKAIKEEIKAGDMDLYNSILHNQKEYSSKESDTSRRLQEIEAKIAIEKENSKKLDEDRERTLHDIENAKRIKEEQERLEIERKTSELEALKRTNLEKTMILNSIKDELAQYMAENGEKRHVA